MEKLTYSVDETAQLLGISRNNAFRLANIGHLPAVRIGKRLFVPKAALEKFLENTGVGTAAKAAKKKRA